MNRHAEVVGLEVVGHLAEALERVLAHGLLEAECLARLAALLCDGRSAHHREAFTTAGVCVLSGQGTSATHFGQRQSPLGTSCSGGIRQKVW